MSSQVLCTITLKNSVSHQSEGKCADKCCKYCIKHMFESLSLARIISVYLTQCHNSYYDTNALTSGGNYFFQREKEDTMNDSHFCYILKLQDLSPKELYELLKSWEMLANDISEIQKKVKELQCMVKLVDGKSSGRQSSRGVTAPKDPKVSNEKAVALVEWMIRDHMMPIEGLPLHEIFCFKKVDRLQIALLGDSRKRIQADLLEFHKYLCCSCCSNRESRLLPSFHDTSILYILVQEHGDVINIHDLFQSFKLTVTRPSTKVKSKSKNSPLPKKRKSVDNSHSCSEAAIQARFCKAISELQITGLLRMPSKRRPDFVQRVAFGL